MRGIYNILPFKGDKMHKGERIFFGITVVASCKGYDWGETLLCFNSIYSHLTRTCQGLIFKKCKVHSQVEVHVQIMRPMGSKGDNLDQFSLQQ